MLEATFTLRTLTPLFLAGADQEQAELRAPSFRGLMRYWQRALVGGLVGTDEGGLKQVRNAETALFGATDTGSAVAVRVSAVSTAPREFTEQTRVRSGGTWQATGKGYLLWSMAKSGRVEKGNLKPARWFFPPGTTFQLTLSARNAPALHQAIATLWLLTHLGGIGSRARRCAGSLAIQPMEASSAQLPTGLPFAAPKNVEELKLDLERGIRKARKIMQEAHQIQPRALRQAQFDILARDTCHIWLLHDGQPWPNAEIAMRELGESLQDYRRDIPLGRRAIFGLPLMPTIKNKRRASPLLLHVAELQGGTFVGVAVLFKTGGNGIVLEDYALIEKWVDDFRGKQEVTL